MNKTTLTQAVITATGLSKADATRAVAAIFDPADGIIAASVTRGEKVSITGFGTFNPKTRAARVGTNPSTGASLNIPERNTVTFSAGTTLKSTLNG